MEYYINYNVCYKLDQDETWQFICRISKFPTDKDEGNMYGYLSNGENAMVVKGAFSGIIFPDVNEDI